MGRRAFLVGVLLAACSPGEPQTSDAPISTMSDGGTDPNDGAKSGSRLKLTWYEFTDGTRQFSGMYDAEAKQLCSPYYPAWLDGNVYCTPNFGGDVVYTNATCTTKALHYYVDTMCPQPVPSYYLEFGTAACRSVPAHLYARGGAIAAANYYYKSSNGTCGAANATQTYDKFYTFGAEVPPATLVQLSLSEPEGTARLGVRYYESADGMRFPWVLHDSTLGTDCSAAYYSDGATAARCVPTPARYAYLAHDASCSQLELAMPSTCPAPAYAYTFPSTSCPDESETYYAVAAPTTSSPLYQPSGASCIATTASAGTSYFALGAPASPAPLTHAADTGTAHRVQLIHYTTPDGVTFRDPYLLYDAQMSTQCYPEQLPDGSIRCIASGGYISSYFANSGCTTPIDIVEIYKGPSTCTAPTVPAYARKSVAPAPGTCSYSSELHAITTVHVGPVYYGAPGSCTLYTPYEATLYNIGPVVPLTNFVAATIATDN